MIRNSELSLTESSSHSHDEFEQANMGESSEDEIVPNGSTCYINHQNEEKISEQSCLVVEKEIVRERSMCSV